MRVRAQVLYGQPQAHANSASWPAHDAKAWEKLQEEALRRRDKGIKKIPTIFGIDSDGRAVNVARRNLERAGLSGKIKVYQLWAKFRLAR